MNGARILVEELIHQGVRVIFGYPGGAVLDIYNELYLASEIGRASCRERV